MDPEPEVIRQDIDRTRESLTEKLETLEGQVKQTIGSVTSTVDTVKEKVEGTVEAVSSSVEKTVQKVKRTFDLSYQTQLHPYGMAGGAILTGAVVGWLVTGRRSGPRREYPRRRGTPPPTALAADGRSEGGHRPEEPGLMSRFLEPLAGEFDRIKATAIGALVGMARDAVVRSLPASLAPHVQEILDNIARRAGGEVIRGAVLPQTGATPASGPAGQNY
jgi:uncharacterized protein YjbJ (UPF0337 family)